MHAVDLIHEASNVIALGTRVQAGGVEVLREVAESGSERAQENAKRMLTAFVNGMMVRVGSGELCWKEGRVKLNCNLMG
ncbi:hypothetical protein Hanom_Chr17g01570931 [Helianthus anomalus]